MSIQVFDSRRDQRQPPSPEQLHRTLYLVHHPGESSLEDERRGVPRLIRLAVSENGLHKPPREVGADQAFLVDSDGVVGVRQEGLDLGCEEQDIADPR